MGILRLLSLKKLLSNIYYDKEGIKYFIGDKVTGSFEFEEKIGTVKFGEFEAYWPSGAHEWASAYGFYVETKTGLESIMEYSITQVNELSKME